MRKQKVLYYIVICLLCIGVKSYAQISTSTTQGCAPLNVSFTGFAGATSPAWNFGTGSGTSLLPNPSNIYTTPGIYNVTYTAMVSGSPVSGNVQITVHQNPTGSFTYVLPPSHCKPMTVNFTGSGGSPGSTYGWVFGDLTGGSGSSPSHTYNLQGSFSPSMTVTDGVTGCSSQAIGNGVINVSTPPNMVISANPGLSSCTAPFVTSFSGSGSTSGSPTGSALSYSWSFGNGTPSSTQASPPAVTYAQGVYTVILTGTDNNGCSSTASTQVSVVQPTVSAVIPGTVCIGAPFNVTVQSNQINTFWNMGDNSSEQFQVPVSPTTGTVHIYNTPGQHTISITVQSGQCSATQTYTTFVQQILPEFTGLPPFTSCNYSMSATYSNQTTSNIPGSLSYTWATFWDPAAYNHSTFTSTTAPQPTFVFYQNSLNPYTIYDPFNPTISLFVRSTFGCTAFITHAPHTVMRPTAWFNKDKKEGCAPLTVKLRDTSFTNTALYPITSYTWNNGANPPVIVSGVLSPPAPIPPQTFTYSSPGTYTPFLSIATASGCTDVSFIDTVIVVNPPVVSASFPTLVCAGQPVTVSVTATPTTVQHWHVETDNGYFSGCVSNPNPTFPFTHIGVQSLTVSAYQNSCPGSSVYTQSITVKGPLGQSRYTTNCINRKDVVFDSYLQEAATGTLNFGDNTTPLVINANATGVFSHSVMHTYNATGDYTATLTSLNPSSPCAAHTYTMKVIVRDVQANIFVNGHTAPNFPILPDYLACTGSTVTFDGSPSLDEATSCKRGYSWSFQAPGLPSILPSVDSEQAVHSRSFATAGIYTVTLLVKDVNGCADTAIRRFRISAANPNFTFAVNPICLSDNPVRLFNTTNTTIANPDPNINFKWEYGDPFSGQVDITPLVTYTAQHSYVSVAPPYAIFTAALTSTNTSGCVATITHTVRVNNPSAAFYPSKPIVCIPEPILFTGPTPLYASYKISYSDSSQSVTTSTNTFSHNYITSGIHHVTLTVTDNAGCKNTSSIQIDARVRPVASFTTVPPANFCAPATITFTNTSTTTGTGLSDIVNYTWDIGTGPLATNSTSATSIFQTGNTTITLIVSTANGYCPATYTMPIYVYDTKGTLVLNKTKFCIGETIIASLTNTSDALNWIVNVGFGIQPSAIPVAPTQSLSHTYTNTTQSGPASVVATINSPHNSCVFSTNAIPIEIVYINPEFKRNNELLIPDSIHCLKIPDRFTHGINNSTNPLVYTWDFGNGQTAVIEQATYTYTLPGVYTVSLSVKDSNLGCQASSVKNMTINPLPTATFSVPDNCPNKPFVINGTGSQGVISGTWSPAANIVGSPNFTTTAGTGLSSFASNAQAAESGTFSLRVTDASGCVSDTVIKTSFIQPLAHPMVWDTTVIIGEPIPLNASQTGQGFTYSWTPVTTDLDCLNCYNPTSTSTVDITYTVIISDNLGCAEVKSTYKVIIEPKTTVDVPTAFTPNGDGRNDIIYVDGWGIKSLQYFRIYNRWGELLFETNDIKTGWDGFYNGLAQNMETYVYQVSVETYLDAKPIFKTGTFKLIR